VIKLLAALVAADMNRDVHEMLQSLSVRG